jgi:VanZ family protein
LIPVSTGISTDIPIDKLVHIVINAALIFLWVAYFFKKGLLTQQKVIVLLFLSIAYGIIIELCQEYFTTSRSADVFDVVANIVGCLTGLLIFKFLKFKFSS